MYLLTFCGYHKVGSRFFQWHFPHKKKTGNHFHDVIGDVLWFKRRIVLPTPPLSLSISDSRLEYGIYFEFVRDKLFSMYILIQNVSTITERIFIQMDFFSREILATFGVK